MSLILDGTNGLSDVDGSAATPAIRGSDANTGVFFGTDIVGVSTGGTERVRVDASGRLLVGTTSDISGGAVQALINGTGTSFLTNAAVYSALSTVAGREIPMVYASDTTDSALISQLSGNMAFFTQGNERARIDSSGNLLVGITSNVTAGARIRLVYNANAGNIGLSIQATLQDAGTAVQFVNSGGSVCGTITQGTSTTAYNTSSDYRLKHDIAPMTGALAKVAALKPVTYRWNADNSESQGFIAHELQEVVPECVTGEKDAVDAEGNPQYQGIDTSFLVATLTAAIQEQQAIITALTARVEALEGAQA
jgi:hypothetical protein